jgi:ribose transport system substrate-binding protein
VIPAARPVLVVGAIAVLLIGCGAAPATPTAGSTVSLLVASRQISVSTEMGEGFEAGVAQIPGATAVVTGPDVSNGPVAVQMFDGLTRSSPGGISVFTLSPDLFVGPVADAVHAGIPVIAVDNPLQDSSDVTLFIGNDNYELGQLLARQVVAEMNPRPTSGTVVLGTSVPGVPVLDQRATGLRAEFEQLLPGVTVLGPFDTKIEVDLNLAAWRVLVEGHPEAVAFVGTGDADSYHLGELHHDSAASWIGGGFDLDRRSMEAVRNGDVVLVSPEHFLKGVIAGRLQAAHLGNSGELPEGWIYLPGLAVDRTNIGEVIARQSSAESKRRWFHDQAEEIINHLPAHTRPLGDVE